MAAGAVAPVPVVAVSGLGEGLGGDAEVARRGQTLVILGALLKAWEKRESWFMLIYC